MENEFKRQLLGEWKIDHEFEFYVKSWLVYHQTADQIDGDIEIPRTREEYRLVHLAAKSAQAAQDSYMSMNFRMITAELRKDPRWTQANKEAMWRLYGKRS